VAPLASTPERFVAWLPSDERAGPGGPGQAWSLGEGEPRTLGPPDSTCAKGLGAGRTLALVGTFDRPGTGRVTMWRVDDPAPRVLLDEMEDEPCAFAVAPDETWALVGTSSRRLLRLDLRRGSVVDLQARPSARLRWLALDPRDPTRAAALGEDGRLQLWQVERDGGRLRREQVAHTGRGGGVVVLADGRLVTAGAQGTATGDGELLVWSPDGALLEGVPLPLPLEPITALGASPDGRELLAGTLRGRVLRLSARR
jgi:hypothetical protein